MMTEKILAAAEAQTAAAVAAMRGSKTHVVAGKAVDSYGKRVRAQPAPTFSQEDLTVPRRTLEIE